jgi:hypothetical protein
VGDWFKIGQAVSLAPWPLLSIRSQQQRQRVTSSAKRSEFARGASESAYRQPCAQCRSSARGPLSSSQQGSDHPQSLGCGMGLASIERVRRSSLKQSYCFRQSLVRAPLAANRQAMGCEPGPLRPTEGLSALNNLDLQIIRPSCASSPTTSQLVRPSGDRASCICRPACA